jgi:hypothetical protein
MRFFEKPLPKEDTLAMMERMERLWRQLWYDGPSHADASGGYAG